MRVINKKIVSVMVKSLICMLVLLMAVVQSSCGNSIKGTWYYIADMSENSTYNLEFKDSKTVHFDMLDFNYEKDGDEIVLHIDLDIEAGAYGFSLGLDNVEIGQKHLIVEKVNGCTVIRDTDHNYPEWARTLEEAKKLHDSGVGSFDAFADLSVGFEGISPYGYTNFRYNGDELRLGDFNCDKTYGLRNGDIIEVSISDAYMDDYSRNHGMIPETTSKAYTVSGMPEYVSAYSDLPEDFLTDIKKEAEDYIYSYVAKSSEYGDNKLSLSNLEYAGYIYDLIKDEKKGDYLSYNHLYIIYKGDVSSSLGGFRVNKMYYPVNFSHVFKGEDGTISYTNEGIEGYSNSVNDTWYFSYGYKNPFKCYKDIVEDNSDYIAECGDGFEIYAEDEGE